MEKYKTLANTLGAVLVAALGTAALQSGGDWKVALDAIAMLVITAVIKALNPVDGDVGVNSRKE